MRLWSLNPRYLDQKGLNALWREGLLAQKVLQGKTKGYKNHPQLERFKNNSDPMFAIGHYLHFIWKEAESRGYNYDYDKILYYSKSIKKIQTNCGQLMYEFIWLQRKLFNRDAEKYYSQYREEKIVPHPIFEIKEDYYLIETWEKIDIETYHLWSNWRREQ